MLWRYEKMTKRLYVIRAEPISDDWKMSVPQTNVRASTLKNAVAQYEKNNPGMDVIKAYLWNPEYRKKR